MSWQDESEPNIKYCMGTAVGWFTKSPDITLDTNDGEPMEFE